MSVLAALLVAAVAALGSPAAAQLALAGTCHVQTAQLARNWLGMYCNNLNTPSFAYNWTWIDLDWCVANSGGALVGKNDGNYRSTCIRCTAALAPAPAGSRAAGRQGGAVYDRAQTLALRCSCLTGRGRQAAAAALDLNTVLVNVDGALGCYGHLGNKTLAGPPPKQ